METKLTNTTSAISAAKKIAKSIAAKDKPAKNFAAQIIDILEKQSAEDIVQIDLRGKSSICDDMIIASGRSNRHVNALADYVKQGLKELGVDKLGVEGLDQCDWVLIDAGDIILHLFRPEVREYYALEKMWSVPSTNDDAPASNT